MQRSSLYFPFLLLLVYLSHIEKITAIDDEDHEVEHAVLAAHEFGELDICMEPPPPMNGALSCSKHNTKADRYVCRAKCNAGFQFPNGKLKARHLCDLKTGKWAPVYAFPDCIHICNPTCENEGQCTEGNHCVCIPQYRGDRCQYNKAWCDPEQYFHSSGQWACNHTDTETTCVLTCPLGTKLETKPADSYVCDVNGSWSTSFAPQCIPINIIEPPAPQSLYSLSYVHKQPGQPSSGACATWSAQHYRTFDGGIYSIEGGSCSYLFAKDCQQNTFSVLIQNSVSCDAVTSCPTAITIYSGSEEYLISNDEVGPIVYSGGERYNIPVVVNGIIFQMLSDYVTVKSALGFRLKWNRKNTIVLNVSPQLMNKTCGLCGKFDGSSLNDLETSDGSLTDNVEEFVNSWSMELLGEKCEQRAAVRDSCLQDTDRIEDAKKECQAIFSDKYTSCHAIVDPKPYFKTCKADYCKCDGCQCSTFAEYFRECSRLGGKVEGGWRSDQLCPLSCPNGMVYNDCGTSCPKTCKGTVYDCEDEHCIDGCHCPTNMLFHKGECIEKTDCPCLHNDKEQQPGSKVLQECNACECRGGQWECTTETCDARCSSTGDPHYTTFDGLSYEHLGSCAYYLVFHENFTIIQDNGPCDQLDSTKFCTRGVRIESAEGTLLLQPGIKVTFNEKENELPLIRPGISVTMATDLFLKVTLLNTVSLLWDGHNRIYIDASPSLFDQTMGLCGTFNKNQNDDFLTPEGDVEADIEAFTARWQASDSCSKRGRRSQRSACELQPQKIADVEFLCSVLNSHTFQGCHGDVDPYPFFRGCINDLCMCGEKLETCLCPIISDYSMACSKKGVIINWIDELPVCKVECPSGQEYTECGNPCTSTCSAIASGDDQCKAECVQGCACTGGMSLNNEGVCVAQCPCFHNEKEYKPSEITIQGSKTCECVNGRWHCRLATFEELVTPDANKCLDENNEEFTDCVDACPQTCQNKHLLHLCKTEECTPGCRCKEGFILDSDLKKCIDVSQCPCIHANKKYQEGDIIHQDCNLCSCQNGTWQCSEKVCPGVCTAWGESHFKTYDGRIFDFHGECEYILSKGKMKGASYSLSIQNVPCGTGGATCSKSFTLEMGTLTTDRGDISELIAEAEKITFTKDEPMPKTSLSSRFVVFESGLFVMIYTDIGVTIRWNKGTLIYVTLDPKWRNRVQGLCGNFNDDQVDDFCTPSGNLPEVNASIFADSWKIHEFCPKPHTFEDMCSIHPHRKSWAQHKCGVLKSELFSPCRAVVNVEPFYERCVFDTCACDVGGDCDCLCTAIAAYAQECSMHGEPIKWRSQELCPIQCEECSVYDSCIPPCPKKTCENQLRYSKIQTSACSTDFCAEGCHPKPCPEGQIYNNEKEYKCIPKEECVVPCLEINGVLYNEGERINDVEVADPCQSCHCQHRAITCSGTPCVKNEPYRECIKTGWTDWMNTPSFVGGDYEKLSNPLLKKMYENFCGVTNMTAIECRVASTKIPHEKSGQNVLCQLPHGLLCLDSNQKRRICEDYEIRVFCDCGPPPTPETEPPLAAVCESTGWTPWMSSHWPNVEGESETLERLRYNHEFCAEEEIENIECRETLSWRYSSEEEVVCNKKIGLVCKGPRCPDYEVRVFCNCKKEETTPTVARGCVSGWTEYFNIDHPDRSDMGDDESLNEIQKLHEFCVGGTLKDIECKTLQNGELLDYASLKNAFGLKCSLKEGFLCNKYTRPEPCEDFMVRFLCECEREARILTPVPPTPVPVECGWTPWLNIDTPDDGEGDMEDISAIQTLYRTCGGKDLIDIECRVSQNLSLQNNIVCDTVHGLHCKNDDQIEKCYDYEVRLLCMYDWCYPPTTTPAPTTTESPCAPGFVYDECAYNCSQMCSPFVKELTEKCIVRDCIEGCRPAKGCQIPNVWRDFHTCVNKEECTCVLDNEEILGPNQVVEKDCEKCQCVHDNIHCYKIPGCGETIPPQYLIRNITQEDCWTEWISIDEPSSEGGDLEAMSKLRKKFEFCFNPIKIECRTISSKQKPYDVGQIVTCNLEKGLLCWNNDNMPEGCYDYEIRFYCPCSTTPVPTTTTTTPAPTLEPGACTYGWTDWINNHSPNNRGDFESIQKSRISHVFCANDMITGIECRRVGDRNSGSYQRTVTCDLHTGLVCVQERLNLEEECWDYEVRFFCDCPTVAPITETVPPTTRPVHEPCAYWSKWINEHHPSTTKATTKGGGKRKGDTEKAMLLKLQREYQFCLEGYLSNIECREASTDLLYTETGDKSLQCSLYGGFRCRAKDQENGICKDYKIRYYCSCEEQTTSTPIKIVTPTIYVKPCTEFYNIVDGPLPLPDSSIKASSSKDTDSGPQNARLSSKVSSKSAGAWIAGDLNEQQFIEIDLIKIQPVYGVVTKGRNGFDEWVKTYKVLYSRDGVAYAYVTDPSDTDNKDKIFIGNFDSDTPIQHIFQRPFEARFVRIQPLGFHRDIAMRVDVLVCAEGLTLPTTTVAAPICVDDMGLYNGSIQDFQIITSSNIYPNASGKYIRLNNPQTDVSVGGWVAADADQNQFVQINFVEPRNLTGVKIQGRDQVPEWVTAFTVSYSLNGKIWNNVIDSNSDVLIFPGNYDSNTIVENYFPKPVRARYLKIHPLAWQNWIAMRLEIIGCYEHLTDFVKEEVTHAPTFYFEGCAEPMGFENHQLPDTLISVSSSMYPTSGSSRIRLNTHADADGTGGWIPAVSDYMPVVVIDFYGVRNLTGITTQGLEEEEKWVMSYYVKYSIDSITWEDAEEKLNKELVFQGNSNNYGKVTRLFKHMIEARYLKIIIVDYHTGPGLRMEVLGCFVPYLEATLPPAIVPTETEFCIEYGPWVSFSDPASDPYGDEEPISQVIAASASKCSHAIEIQCRTLATQKDYSETGQLVTCDMDKGLVCRHQDQSSYKCYNYEVRIKCWTCSIETTTLRPLELCPEVPLLLKSQCPVSCPLDYACDGYECVPHMNCPCFVEDRRFKPSDISFTRDCKRCECILGGYSNCRTIECGACLKGQKSLLDERCQCQCEGCPEGTVLCPNGGECIKEEQWCDGIIDCLDDERDCPTTTVPTTSTTFEPTTTESPIICSTDSLSDTDSCEMFANLFDTFDGLTYQYEICDHVLMRESNAHLYGVTVHKTCSPEGFCQKYLVIDVDEMTLKLGPGVNDVTVHDQKIPVSNLWLVSQRFQQDFSLEKKGNSLIFISKKYHFSVTWDSSQNAKITVSKCLAYQVLGLCGFYNHDPSDDLMLPIRKLAISNEDFGNSWGIGPPDRCTPPTCPLPFMKTAITFCNLLREEPFNSSCSDYVKIENRIEACTVFMCDCLQTTSLDARNKDVFYDIYEESGSCKCLAYESFVEACETSKQEPVRDWRLKFGCTPECPPGLEWKECGEGCQLTCDNYRVKDEICKSGGCAPGCYCPDGTVLHHNRCVAPKMCQDCVCRGHGDPNFITFDGQYYAFQGTCTYVLVQHLNDPDPKLNFRVLVTNVECPEEPHTSCAEGLRIEWNGHVVEKFKNKPVYLDDVEASNGGDDIHITYVPGKSTVIHIKHINLAVRYFDQMYGFNIELPAFYYFNKTEGLCGLCNFEQSDDLYHRDGFVTDDIDDFAYSWLVEHEHRKNCELPRVPVPEPPPGICNFTISPCEIFLNPTMYSKSCQNDVTYSHKPEASMCRSKFQYAQQCCERGVSLVEWLKLSGCENTCPEEGMTYECTSACPKTCDNYKNYHPDDCDLLPLYTCKCPEEQVYHLGKCVDSITCETCDAFGHVVGEVWTLGPCEMCECMADLTTKCTVIQCPEPPICSAKETLNKVQHNDTTCCDTYRCVEIAELKCPDIHPLECREGESNIVEHIDGCPSYLCKCMPELCPPLLGPLLEEGEDLTIETEDCCPRYVTKCYTELCRAPPACGPGFKLSKYQGKCCEKYTCVPRNDVCVYQHKYDVINGTQIELLPEQLYDMEYQAGSVWQDGLCFKCLCMEMEGQFISTCREEICPKMHDLPDAEKYVREVVEIPGACCPSYRRTACMLEGTTYQIGLEWPSPDGDFCKKYSCVADFSGEAAIMVKTINCQKECPEWAVYAEASPESNKCCGKCVPTQCEEDGLLYDDGATWISKSQPCYTATCTVRENGTHIAYKGESCPIMPENCPLESIRTDPKGCCSYCKTTTDKCNPVQVAAYETRGYFTYVDPIKGSCMNHDALKNLTKCAGYCSSESLYSNLEGDFHSICNCCLPIKTKDRIISLTCHDGSTVEKLYQQPLLCECRSCSGTDRSHKAMNQIEPY